MTNTSYLFNQTERAIFVEIYFPKRSAYYGSIYDALRYGYEEKVVKNYLHDEIEDILKEFNSFPDLFNPYRYVMNESLRAPVPEYEARERINFYQSPFKGWSVYTVDGVWFNDDEKSEGYKKPVEEATQVVRLMFRPKPAFAQKAINAGCMDVHRSILFWVISQQGRIQEHKVWGTEERDQFMERNGPWTPEKEKFVRRYFTRIARHTGKWMDDCVLFVFGYLVRSFWKNVVAEKLAEKEIWVTSLFNLTLNVVEEIKS